MKIVQRLDEATWSAFVEANPRGNIFHTPRMFRVFAEANGHQPGLWAVLGDAGQVLALFSPVQVTVLGGLLRGFTTRAVAFGSVLCAPGRDGRQALGLLLRTYNQSVNGKVLFTELRNLSDLSDAQPELNACDFRYEDHLNFSVDLTRSHSDLWRTIRANARRNIQKAKKSGVAIEEVRDLDGVAIAYQLLQAVYSRIKVPLPDESLFRSAFLNLGLTNNIKILLANVNNQYVGVMTLLLYKGVVYYWYTGTLREYAECRAGDLLVWYGLEFGNQHGFHTFDFGGAGRPDEKYGVRDFKAKFGGTLVNYGRNTRVHSPAKLKLSQSGYRLMKGLLF